MPRPSLGLPRPTLDPFGGSRHSADGMSEVVAAYRAARERVAAMVATRSGQDLARRVPACPAWTVKDVVSHLAGITADALARNSAGVGTEAWTAAQVERRRGATIDQVLSEWAANADPFEALLARLPAERQRRLLGDIASHEADLRAALGLPAEGGSEAEALGFTRYLGTLGERLDERGLPALRLVGDDGEWVAGSGSPAATVRADTHTLFRALTGRRSPARIRALHWEGDAEPYVAAFSNYPCTESDEVE